MSGITPTASPKYGTAVVIGASLGGSSVAAALAPVFERVILLDRDQLPDEPARRPGVPHSSQFHTLTAGGRTDLEGLFPGLTEEIVAAGAPCVDPTLTARYASKAGWFPRQPSSMKLLQVTRRYLEWYMRNRVAHLANVEVRDDARVMDLQIRDGVATGVTVENSAGETETIVGDLVVDASGRASKLPDWLVSHGYPAPPESVVNARWGYATLYVRVPEGYDPGWSSLYIGPTVNGPGLGATRGGAMWFQESNLMVVTAQGCAGDLPPGTVDEFVEWISSFGNTEFKALIERYDVVSDVETWRNTSNRMRAYWDVDERPENLVVVGDAAAAFNPIYGQGMTLAARGALVLRSALDEFGSQHGDGDLTGFAGEYFTKLHDLVQGCWEFSTGADLNIPGVEVDGKMVATDEDNPAAAYADRVLALATEDPSIALKFFETSHLVRTTEWLGDPALLERVQGDWDRLGTVKRTEEAVS